MTYPAWQSGQRITAGRLNAMVGQWSPWTPTWTTQGASVPSYGNATLTARYVRNGNTVMWRYEVAFGSTTTFGANSDNWLIALPAPATDTALIIGYGEGSMSLGSRFPIRARALTTTQMGLEIAGGRVDATALSPTGLIDNGTPWVWSSGNTIRIQGHYEAA